MISSPQASAGDLLFWQGNSGSGYWNQQNGFRHVGFCAGPNETYQAFGGNSTRSSGFYPLSSVAWNLALQMSTVRWGNLT
jgi:cell wall-associated NlpC family hydrolase